MSGNPLAYLRQPLVSPLTQRKVAGSVCAKLPQLCPTLCNPIDCSLLGSSVHGILQARIREGCHFLLQGIFLTQESNVHLLSLLHWQAGSLPLVPPGKPLLVRSMCLQFSCLHFLLRGKIGWFHLDIFISTLFLNKGFKLFTFIVWKMKFPWNTRLTILITLGYVSRPEHYNTY